MKQHQSQTTAPFTIRVDRELTDPQVVNLLREHLADMFAESPPDKVYALDLNGLRQPEITFLTAWRQDNAADEQGGDQLVACGAIKQLDPLHGELKSMPTTARFLRQGAAQAILTELLAIAQRRGYARVSLETGSTPGFDAAVAMYRRFGFVEGGPFSDYLVDPFSRLMTLRVELALSLGESVTPFTRQRPRLCRSHPSRLKTVPSSQINVQPKTDRRNAHSKL